MDSHEDEDDWPHDDRTEVEKAVETVALWSRLVRFDGASGPELLWAVLTELVMLVEWVPSRSEASRLLQEGGRLQFGEHQLFFPAFPVSQEAQTSIDLTQEDPKNG